MFLPYQFTAKIDMIDYGRMVYAVVFVPAPLAKKLPFESAPRLRVMAELRANNTDGKTVEHAGALLPEARGHYILLSRKLLTRLNAQIGDEISVAFAIDDPERVDTPPVLSEALAEEPDLDEAWQALTPGKRRGLAYRIAQAKTESTQLKRIDELRAELLG